MNPSIPPLELIYVEVRHEELMREADQQRLVNEALQGQPSKANIVQSLRSFFSRANRIEETKPTSKPTAASIKRGKASPRTA